MLNDIKGRLLDRPFVNRIIPIALSVWIIGLTAYYCINTPWLSFISAVRPDTKQLIEETLKFQWVPVFLSRLPYVFYVLILNFIALLIGNRILRLLKVDFNSNLNRIIFSIPLGWGIYSIGIFYLGISKLLYVEAVYLFLTLLGVLSILEVKRFFSPPHPTPLPTGERIEERGSCHCESASGGRSNLIDKTDLVFLPVIIIFVFIQLVTSFSPVWSSDPLIYHMALPKLYIRHHALVHVPGFFYSTLPAQTEMLYLLGLITSGETLSKLFSFSISSLFLIFIFSIGNRYFSKGVGFLACINLLIVPTFLSGIFSEPYVDIALGLFSLLGIYAFFMWMEEKRKGCLYLSIICFASAAATKIHGLFFVLLFFVGFFVTVKKGGQFLKKLLWCILAVSIIALPWYIRSWWLTGDPVFPFLYKYLGANYWNEYSNECFWEFCSGLRGVKSFFDFIRINKSLFSLEKFSVYTNLSPVIVIFLMPALITFKNWNKLIKYLFLITLVYYIFFLFTSPQIRFFYAGLAMLSIIVAYFIKTIWTKYLLTKIPIILCIVASSIISFHATASVRWIEGPFFAGLGVLVQRQFLNERFHYRVAAWVNKNLPQDSKILTWYFYGYHLEREYMCVNPVYQGVLDFGRINDAPTFLKSVKELDITHIIYRSIAGAGNVATHTKEFLDKCVSELIETGEIIKIEQIESCEIYSLAVPTDYFALDSNTIKFSDKSYRKYLVKGWSGREEWGTWSEGKESVILVNFKGLRNEIASSASGGLAMTNNRNYTMLIKATGFSVPGKQQSVRIYLDDNLLGEHTFTHPVTHFEDIEMKIPLATLSLPSPLEGEEQVVGNHRIKFVYSFVGSPAEHGMGPDVRQLAMGVSSIEFK